MSLRRERNIFWALAGAMLAVSVVALHYLAQWNLTSFVIVFAVLMSLYGLAGWHVLRAPVDKPAHGLSSLTGILLIAAALRCIALFAPQALSTDAFRYVWDGRVQAAGINPYRYLPSDPALTSLRDRAIYPNINRATYAHTIYPPTAQAVFLAVERLSDSIVAMKLAMLTFDAFGIGCAIALLRMLHLPDSRILLYAWHPLPIWEFAGTGHIDALAVSLALLALLLTTRRSPVWSGVALAAATLVKYYPAILLPALYRRWDWRLPVAFLITVGLLYLPYIGVGREVFGFLSGYAAEEGLSDGSGIYLMSLLKSVVALPSRPMQHVYIPLAACIMGCLALYALQRSRAADTRRTLLDALLLIGGFTLLVSPHDPWYFTVFVPFLCFRLSLAHVWLTGACVLMYVLRDPNGLQSQSLIYAPFVFLLLAQTAARRYFDLPETIDANNPPPRITA